MCVRGEPQRVAPPPCQVGQAPRLDRRGPRRCPAPGRGAGAGGDWAQQRHWGLTSPWRAWAFSFGKPLLVGDQLASIKLLLLGNLLERSRLQVSMAGPRVVCLQLFFAFVVFEKLHRCLGGSPLLLGSTLRKNDAFGLLLHMRRGALRRNVLQLLRKAQRALLDVRNGKITDSDKA